MLQEDYFIFIFHHFASMTSKTNQISQNYAQKNNNNKKTKQTNKKNNKTNKTQLWNESIISGTSESKNSLFQFQFLHPHICKNGDDSGD